MTRWIEAKNGAWYSMGRPQECGRRAFYLKHQLL